MLILTGLGLIEYPVTTANAFKAIGDDFNRVGMLSRIISKYLQIYKRKCKLSKFIATSKRDLLSIKHNLLSAKPNA